MNGPLKVSHTLVTLLHEVGLNQKLCRWEVKCSFIDVRAHTYSVHVEQSNLSQCGKAALMMLYMRVSINTSVHTRIHTYSKKSFKNFIIGFIHASLMYNPILESLTYNQPHYGITHILK